MRIVERRWAIANVVRLSMSFVSASWTMRSVTVSRALVANAQQAMREAGVKRNRMAGDPECGWIVADFIDVVVHVFSREARAYYAIEKLWN